MNDTIVIYVVGGSSNREVAELAAILRNAGCTGKISFKKISRDALAHAEAAIGKTKGTEERHRIRAWG